MSGLISMSHHELTRLEIIQRISDASTSGDYSCPLGPSGCVPQGISHGEARSALEPTCNRRLGANVSNERTLARFLMSVAYNS